MENFSSSLGFYEQLSQALLRTNESQLHDVGLVYYIILLVISATSSTLISYLYLRFFNARSTGSQIYKAFPLLGMAITALFLGIQFSLPLSLGLLGALSIVRFRTPIKEPEEIAFVMVVIANAIAIATFNVIYSAVIIGVSYLVLVVLSKLPKWDSTMKVLPILNIDLEIENGNESEFNQQIVDLANENNIALKLISISNQGTKLSSQYQIEKADDVSVLLSVAKAKYPEINIGIYGVN